MSAVDIYGLRLAFPSQRLLLLGFQLGIDLGPLGGLVTVHLGLVNNVSNYSHSDVIHGSEMNSSMVIRTGRVGSFLDRAVSGSSCSLRFSLRSSLFKRLAIVLSSSVRCVSAGNNK